MKPELDTKQFNKILHQLSYLKSHNLRALYAFCDRTLKELETYYGFIFLKIIIEDTKQSGVICFSQDGNEIHREIIQYRENLWWKYNLLEGICKNLKED